MAEGTLPRTGLTTFGTDQDQHPNRVKYNAELQKLEDKVALFTQGDTGVRPSSGKSGSFFWDETLGKLQYDTGTAWAELINIGGGGVGRDITPAVAGTEGISTKGARADHTHNLPLASATVHGAMSSTDKAKLDNATSSSTASRLVIRDAGGRAQFIAPSAGADVANKSYVDSMVWDGSDITTGTVSADRLPLASATVNGIVTAADKSKLDGATSAPTASRLVIRDAGGRIQFADPAAGPDGATKAYVDSQIGTRSAAGHTHAGTDITSPIPSAMIPLATPTAPGAMMASDRNLIDAASPQAYANSLVKTDANGRYQAAAPSGPNDVTNRTYVDDAVGGRALASDTHSGDAITSPIPAGMVPLATANTQGAVTSAEKNLLTGVSALATPSALVVRDAAGRTQFADPAAAADAATKSYVDGKATWTGITGKPATFAPTIGTTSTTAKAGNYAPDWGDITNKPVLVSLGYADNNYVSYPIFDARITRGSSYTYLKSPDGGTAFSVNDNNTVGSSAIYNTAITVGTWRAVYVTSGGVLGYSASSRRFKTAERDYVVPLDVLDAVSPKRFKYTEDVKENGLEDATDRVNFIAEDLHDAGLTEYVSYDEGGLPQTINEQLMVNALWSFAKQQQDLIRGLTDRVRALEGE
jgi:hypothetical protein